MTTATVVNTTPNTETNTTKRTSSSTAFYGIINSWITGRRESLKVIGKDLQGNDITEKTIFLDCVYDIPTRQQDGNYKLESQWVDVIVPPFIANRLDKYLVKGKFITVAGNVRLGNYIGKVSDPNGVDCPKCNTKLAVEMNVKKRKVEMVAWDVRLLPGGAKNQSDEGKPLGVTNVVPMDQSQQGTPASTPPQEQQFQGTGQYINPNPTSTANTTTPQVPVAPGGPVNPNEIPF